MHRKGHFNLLITIPRPTCSSPLGLLILHLLGEAVTNVKCRAKKRQFLRHRKPKNTQIHCLDVLRCCNLPRKVDPSDGFSLLASEGSKDVATKYREPRHRMQAIVISVDSALAAGSSLRELRAHFFAKTTGKNAKNRKF
jgi:hypothetical protein